MFIQRTEPFVQIPGQTKVPADLIYEAPLQTCDKHTGDSIMNDPLEGEENLEGDDPSTNEGIPNGEDTIDEDGTVID